MHSKIHVNPVLKTGQGLVDNIYLCFVQKIQAKYGVLRWMDKFPTLTFKNMWMLLNEAPIDNNRVIKNYTNYLEINRPVFNLETKIIEKLQTERKKQLTFSQSLPQYRQLNKNIYLERKRENSWDTNKVENKSSSVNNFFSRSAERAKECLSAGGAIILNSLNSANFSQHIIVKTYGDLRNKVFPLKQALAEDRKLELSKPQYMELEQRQTSEENKRVELDKLQYKELHRKQEYAKRVDNNQEKINEKMGHFIKSHIIKEQLEALRIQSQHQRSIEEGYRNILFNKKEVVWERASELINSVSTGMLSFNLKTLEAPIQLKNVNSFAEDFNIKRTVYHRTSTLIPEVYNEAIIKVQDSDNTNILRYSKGNKTREPMEIFKNSDLTFLKPPKKEVRDSSDSEVHQERPVEKEAYSRTYIAPTKKRNFKDIEADEINLLADRVFKVLEKRIEIRKDRRGMR